MSIQKHANSSTSFSYVNTEMRRAIDAFYTAMMGPETYTRWLTLKQQQCFDSEATFTAWVLDVVQEHLEANECNEEDETEVGGDVDMATHNRATHRQREAGVTRPHKQFSIEPKSTQDCDYNQRITPSSVVNHEYTINVSSPPPTSEQQQARSHISENSRGVDEDDVVLLCEREGRASEGMFLDDFDEGAAASDGEMDCVDLPCHICGVTFLSPDQLSQHVKSHFADDSQSCGGENVKLLNTVINDSFVTGDSSDHCASKSPSRSGGGYECQFCCKTFSMKCNRYRHEKTVHYKQKAHVCSVCHKAFTQGSSLKRHVQTQHTQQQDTA